jgi:uncharacterized DUF497 family protein
VEFEWDDAKAASNLKKHGIAFEDAVLVFKDSDAIELPDDRGHHDEDRWIVLGRVKDQELVVIFTFRGSKTRIISARKAETHERIEYWQNRVLLD